MNHIFLEIAVAGFVALQFFRQRLAAPKVTPETEVERLAVLQQAAVARRAEYAAEREQAARADAKPPVGLPDRRRVVEAEAAYAAARQAWENRQSRQKSR